MGWIAPQCRAAGTCDPDTGICSSPPLADCLSCSDGNRCTTADVCGGGTCVPGQQTACAPGTPQYAVVTDLGVVDGQWSEAHDLNDAGDVVGFDYSPWRTTGRTLGFRHRVNGRKEARKTSKEDRTRRKTGPREVDVE